MFYNLGVRENPDHDLGLHCLSIPFWQATRVKSGIFGQTAKFGHRPCLFHISNIGIKNKLTKQQ